MTSALGAAVRAAGLHLDYSKNRIDDLDLTPANVHRALCSARSRALYRRAAKLGVPVRSYAQRGKQAVLAVPQGALFAMLTSSSGDDQDELADPGEWIWSTLLTRDAQEPAAFSRPSRPGPGYRLAVGNQPAPSIPS
jgi:hypothetical protein